MLASMALRAVISKAASRPALPGSPPLYLSLGANARCLASDPVWAALLSHVTEKACKCRGQPPHQLTDVSQAQVTTPHSQASAQQ